MLAQVARPCFDHGIPSDEGRAERAAVQEREATGHDAVAVTSDGEGLGSLGPPALEDLGRLGSLVAPRDRAHGGPVLRTGRLDRERLGAAREERLAHDWVIDQVEHVRGVAPELSWPGLSHLGAELAPGSAAQLPVADRIGATHKAGNGFANGFVHDEAVRTRVDEREIE